MKKRKQVGFGMARDAIGLGINQTFINMTPGPAQAPLNQANQLMGIGVLGKSAKKLMDVFK